MAKKKLRKILLTTASVFLLLVFVLCLHIYLVTRPKAPDAHTIVMARIDMKQPVSPAEAGRITTWMYGREGIDHVVCNAAMDNIVFTYRPVQCNADAILSGLRSVFALTNATRFIPSEKDLQSSCPVASSSYTYRVYNFMRRVF